MDILELSRKMEGDLLNSGSAKTSHFRADQDSNFSPMLTRSRVKDKGEKRIHESSDENEGPRKTARKVNELEKIYLKQTVRMARKNLETIYEDPKWNKGATLFLGKNKVKRSLYLDREFRITSKQKSKMRKLKMKRLGKKPRKNKKMSDEEFRDQMLRLENYLNGEDCERQEDS